jgi:hypothetical protein
MPYSLTAHLTLSSRGVEQMQVLYPPGQRDQAWLLCRQLLPELERLEQNLAETVPVSS